MQQTIGIARLAFLLTLTVAAVFAMLLINQWTAGAPEAVAPASQEPSIQELAVVAAKRFAPETIDIYDTYAGLLEPWERYTLGFEMAGRVLTLGNDIQDQPLDQGSRVEQGTVLARLDDRILKARLTEAEAAREQADNHYRRAQQLKERGNSAISATDLEDRWTAKLQAEARYEMAVKNLEDATLRSPATGYIARRQILAGESVSPHQPAFELVESDRLLLVLGVPESRMPEILGRWREVRNGSAQGEAFQAHVELVGRDRFGQPWPRLSGRVYRVSETADDKTGLFEVEVEVANAEQRLKPGMVARAQLVIGQVQGYRIPSPAVLFRSDQAYLFKLQEDERQTLASSTSETEAVYPVQRVPLARWSEQGPDVIVPQATENPLSVVVRGQRRLVDGQRVRVIAWQADDEPTLPADVSVRASVAEPKP